MATVNLGSIKFKWKGTYSGATAYTVDDVVEYNGSSYICILASTGNLPTDTAYFEQMSSAGTNGTDGTDLTTTLTTQGDIVYRNASGLARLGAGTSGQVLQTNGTGANPSWVDAASGGIAQVIEGSSSTVYSITSPTDGQFYYPTTNKLTATITPSSTSSRILVQYEATAHMSNNTSDIGVALVLKESISGGSTTEYVPNGDAFASGFYYSNAPGGENYRMRLNYSRLLSPSTTSAITYEVGMYGYNAGTIRLMDNNSTGFIRLMEVTV